MDRMDFTRQALLAAATPGLNIFRQDSVKTLNDLPVFTLIFNGRDLSGFVDEMIRHNKDFELLVIPNRGHEYGNEPYNLRKTWDFFVRHLMGAEGCVQVINATARYFRVCCIGER